MKKTLFFSIIFCLCGLFVSATVNNNLSASSAASPIPLVSAESYCPDFSEDATVSFCIEQNSDGTFNETFDLTGSNSSTITNPQENTLYEWFYDEKLLTPVLNPSEVPTQENLNLYLRVTNYDDFETNPCVSESVFSMEFHTPPIPEVQEIPDICADTDKIDLSTFTEEIGIWEIDGIPADYLSPSDYKMGDVVEVKFRTVNEGCSVFKIQEVQIFPVPEIHFYEEQGINYGSSAKINTHISNGGNDYTYNWIPEDKLLDNQVEDPTTIALFETTTFKLDVTDENGCSASAITAVSVMGYPIEVNPASPKEICQGESTTLDAEISGGTGNFEYEWSSIPYGFESNELNPVVSPMVNTVYYLTVKDLTSNEEATGEASVKVNRVPEISASIEDIVFCEEENNLIEVDIDVATAMYDYEWTGDIYILNDVTSEEPTITVPSYNTKELEKNEYSLQLNVKDENGCATQAPFSVSIKEKPVVTIKTDAPHCSGTDIPITATVHNETGAYTYKWIHNSVLSANDIASPIFYATEAGKNNLAVIVTNENGCSTTTEYELEVVEKPEITLEDKTVCQSKSYMGNISPASITPSQGYKYSWMIDNVNYGTDPSFIINASEPKEYELSLIVSAISDEPEKQCKDTATALITINEAPVANAGNNNYSYIYERFELDGSLSTGEGDLTYTWSPAEYLETPESVKTFGVINTVGHTDFQLTVEDQNGCTNTSSFPVNILAPIMQVSVEDTYHICQEYETTDIEAIASGGDHKGEYTYAWYALPDDKTIISTEQTLRVKPETTTEYQVIAYRGQSVPDTAYTTVEVVPVPEAQFVTFESHMCEGDTKEILLSSNDTENSFEWEINDNMFLGNESFFFEAITSGIYTITVRITGDNNCYTIIEKNITVYEPPAVDLSFDSNEICAESDLLIEANTTSGNAPFLFTWNNNPNIAITGENGEAIVYRSENKILNDVISVEVTDQNNCVATASENITVYPLPVLIEPDLAVCTGTENELKKQHIDAVIEIEESEYISSNETGDGYIVKLDDAKTIDAHYSVTDARGCENHSTFEITSYKSPAITISGTEGCLGEMIDIVATSDVTVQSWKWDFDNDGVYEIDGASESDEDKKQFNSENTCCNPDIPQVGIKAIKYYQSAELMCASDTIVEVIVNLPPAVSIKDAGIIEYGTEAELEAEITRFTTGENYGDYEFIWQNENDISSGIETATITTTPLGSEKEFAVKVTDKNGCSATSSVIIEIGTQPQLDIVWDSENPNDISFDLPENTSPENYQITIRDTLGNIFETIILDGTEIDFDDYNNVEICIEDIYSQYPAQPMCKTIIKNGESENTVGFQKGSISNIQLVPNPAQNFVTITYSNTSAKPVLLTITNLLSETIIEQEITTNKQETISLENIPAGLYFVTISTETAQETKKLIVK